VCRSTWAQLQLPPALLLTGWPVLHSTINAVSLGISVMLLFGLDNIG